MIRFKKWIQICFQLLSIVIPAIWAFGWTFVILQFINILPFMRLKLTPEEEEIGGDWINLGEVACKFLISHCLLFVKKYSFYH